MCYQIIHFNAPCQATLARMRSRGTREWHRFQSFEAGVRIQINLKLKLLPLIPGSACQLACERRRFRHSCARPTATHCCCHCCVALTGRENLYVQIVHCSVGNIPQSISLSQNCSHGCFHLSVAGAYRLTCSKRTK